MVRVTDLLKQNLRFGLCTVDFIVRVTNLLKQNLAVRVMYSRIHG